MTATLPGSHRDIMGIRVAALGWSEALAQLTETLEQNGPQRIFNFLNANNANLAMRDHRYRECLANSEVLPDGVGVEMASRTLHGMPFPANLNGTDFVPALLVYAERPLKIALIGAKPENLAAAMDKFKSATPWHTFFAVSDGYFNKADSSQILEKLLAIDPDITLVAMGTPEQEIWIDSNIRPGHGRIVFGVGALFDFVSGAVPRAPQAVRNWRLEWVWRLIQEPSRLWYRYIVGNPVFLFHLFRYKFQRGNSNAEKPV